MIEPPKGKTRAFCAGWKARLDGQKSDACPYIFKYAKERATLRYDKMLSELYRIGDIDLARVQRVEGIYGRYLRRRQDWASGYTSCSRALGRERKQERLRQETKNLTAEHDEMVELGRELNSIFYEEGNNGHQS